MAAYMVFTREKTLNQGELDTYSKVVGPTLQGREFTSHAVYGKHETLEGPPVEGVVILSFPTYEAALDWYNSPAYAAAREHRFKGAEYRAVIVQGL
jgi:uncharacterized protein (DUF1330 family)